MHAIDPDGMPPFRRYHDPAELRVPEWAGERGVWEDGRLTGIVDWTTGSAGPAAVDVAPDLRDPSPLGVARLEAHLSTALSDLIG